MTGVAQVRGGMEGSLNPGTMVANKTRQPEIGLRTDVVEYDVERPAGPGFDFE